MLKRFLKFSKYPPVNNLSYSHSKKSSQLLQPTQISSFSDNTHLGYLKYQIQISADNIHTTNPSLTFAVQQFCPTDSKLHLSFTLRKTLSHQEVSGSFLQCRKGIHNQTSSLFIWKMRQWISLRRDKLPSVISLRENAFGKKGRM